MRRFGFLAALLVCTLGGSRAHALTPSTPTGAPDADGDGVPDKDDACPDEAGPKSSDKKKNGCPTDTLKWVSLKGTEVKLTDKPVFDVGKATLKASSDPLLDEIASAMKTRGANVDLFEIAVHTDAVGMDTYNVALSAGRAKAVVDALVSRGIAAARLRGMGYGPYCPLDPASTPDARAKNRRVDILILKRGGKKTTAVAGCDAAVQKGIVPPSIP